MTCSAFSVFYTKIELRVASSDITVLWTLMKSHPSSNNIQI